MEEDSYYYVGRPLLVWGKTAVMHINEEKTGEGTNGVKFAEA